MTITIEKRKQTTKNLITILNGRWVPVVEAGEVLGIHPDTISSWAKKGAVMQEFHAEHVIEAMQTPEWKALLAKFDLPPNQKPRTIRSIGQRKRLIAGKTLGCDAPKVNRSNTPGKKPISGKTGDPLARFNMHEREYIMRQVFHKVDLDALVLQGYRKGRIK